MQKTFEAVYEKGVLRPVESLSLPEKAWVRVTIEWVRVTIEDDKPAREELAAYFSPEEWEFALRDDISLSAVREALSQIPGSLADAVIASREDR